jgi:hypothetical protein
MKPLVRRRRIKMALQFLGIGGGIALVGGVAIYTTIHRVKPAPVRIVPRQFASPACRDGFRRFFSRSPFEIRVVFGYKDSRPARFVADRYERMLLIDRLIGACAVGEAACGFRRDSRDVDLLTKVIPAPDGKPLEIRLRVAHASVGADDDENRKNPFQASQTRYAQDLFLEGLAHADVVIYNGHSRAGGGPDFGPPKLRAGDIDFGWYKKNTPGFTPVLEALEKGGPDASEPKLIGFLSCASSTHFLGKIHALRPHLATVTSPKLIYFSDALEATYATLSSILGMKCEPKFTAAHKTAATRAGGARVAGWF